MASGTVTNMAPCRGMGRGIEVEASRVATPAIFERGA